LRRLPVVPNKKKIEKMLTVKLSKINESFHLEDDTHSPLVRRESKLSPLLMKESNEPDIIEPSS
jgi:hypothetical protein